MPPVTTAPRTDAMTSNFRGSQFVQLGKKFAIQLTRSASGADRMSVLLTQLIATLI
jgi:hypothetical protein